MMSNSTIDHAALSTMAQRGLNFETVVFGEYGGWVICVTDGHAERLLSFDGSTHVRLFDTFEMLAAYLREMGIERFSVNLAHWDAMAASATGSSVTSDSLSVDEGASYDKWVIAQVQEAIDDPRPTLSHDQVVLNVRAAIDAASHWPARR